MEINSPDTLPRASTYAPGAASRCEIPATLGSERITYGASAVVAHPARQGRRIQTGANTPVPCTGVSADCHAVEASLVALTMRFPAPPEQRFPARRAALPETR